MPSLPFHSGLQQVLIGLGQALLLHQIGVVGLHEGIEIDRRPLTVLRHRLRQEVGEIGRLHLLQQVLAIERLERRARPGHDVDLEAPGPGLVQDALQDALGVGTPDLDLDAVFLVEGRDQNRNVLGRDRRIEGELLFALGAFDQPLLAVGALVGRDLGDTIRLGRARARWKRGPRRRRVPTGLPRTPSRFRLPTIPGSRRGW